MNITESVFKVFIDIGRNHSHTFRQLQQICTQIGRTVCLYTVLPDLQEKILLKRAVDRLKLWV